MISEKMKKLANNNSVIRAMFEEGQNMARESARRMSMTSLWEIPQFRLPQR